MLGTLPPLPVPVSNHLVTPVPAWWTRPSQVAAVDHAETVDVFRVPVADLLEPANRASVEHTRWGRTVRTPAFIVDGVLVWGFTGHRARPHVRRPRLGRARTTCTASCRPADVVHPVPEIEVTEDLARTLLREQHPDLADLPLTWAGTGWDNALWRVGDQLAARFPVRAVAAPLVEHEQRWLPVLAPRLPGRRADRPSGSACRRPPTRGRGASCPWFDAVAAAPHARGEPLGVGVAAGRGVRRAAPARPRTTPP